MRNKIIFILVGVGVVAAGASAYVYALPAKPLPPVFNPASNPYGQGVFANGIIESYQSQGENMNLYPEVSGVIRDIPVAEGQYVKKGTPLIVIDDSVQRATTEQQKAQAQAALAMLEELKAEPRKETLDVAVAQVQMAAANLKTSKDTYEKQQHSYDIDPRSVSKDLLDNDRNAVKVADANLEVAKRQLQLTQAGAWVFDIRNQERQYESLSKAYAASDALLKKYTIVAPADGTVLSVQATVGSYISPQGVYDTYTQGFDPVAVMGKEATGGYLSVRCYIDEILIPRLNLDGGLQATMFIRGTSVKVPLEFVRVQPYVSPKIELSDERLEKVDLRVLPVIFRFRPPENMKVFPGEMVDVYLGGQASQEPTVEKGS